MPVAEFFHFFDGERVAQRMRHHDSFRLLGVCLLEHGAVNVSLRNGYIHKYRDSAVLNDRRYSRRKTGCNCDDLIARKYTSISEQRRCQCHKGKKICARSGIYNRYGADAQIFSEIRLELLGESACCQPEIQG